jgi:hypothetical protein
MRIDALLVTAKPGSTKNPANAGLIDFIADSTRSEFFACHNWSEWEAKCLIGNVQHLITFIQWN